MTRWNNMIRPLVFTYLFLGIAHLVKVRGQEHRDLTVDHLVIKPIS